MEQRVSIITLGVADLDRSRKFYERLGWRPSIPDTKDIVFFQAGGIALALFPRANLVKDARISPMARASAGCRSHITPGAVRKLILSSLKLKRLAQHY